MSVLSASSAHTSLVGQLDAHADVALFLDIDGTLIDIAATPESVVVPDALPALLTGLTHHLHGALAVVSGRPVQQIDALLSPLLCACAGGHGAQLRLSCDAPVRAADERPGAFALPASLEASLSGIVSRDPRLSLEIKPHSLALHYRAAPDAHDRLRASVDDVLRQHPDIELLAGKMIFEFKRPGFDKGRAVMRFLDQPGFAGRRPIMIGDDITDESAFECVARLGGLFYSVGRSVPGAAGEFADPRAVRFALADALTRAITRSVRA